LKYLRTIEKEWGFEYWINNDADYCMKELSIRPDYQCSLHYHLLKTETFYVVQGRVKIEVYPKITSLIKDGPVEYALRFGDYLKIEKGTPHRFSTPNGSALLIECSTQHFEEDSYRTIPSGRITK